jgi:hypothetical protein
VPALLSTAKGRRPLSLCLRRSVAPLLGAACLSSAAVLLTGDFALLTETDSPVVTALPWLLLIAAVAGIVTSWPVLGTTSASSVVRGP